MTATLHDQIERFLTSKNIPGASTAAGWIAPGLTSPGGRFVVERILRLTVAGSPLQRPFRFACTVQATLGPDFVRRSSCRWQFVMRRDGTFKGRFVGPSKPLPATSPAA